MSKSNITEAIKHIPALDGIRGIAVLFILIYHCSDFRAANSIDDYFFMFTHSMWVGVDLFFVLSGFLITSILINTKDCVNYFKSFYLRRALRIFPLYYLFVAFSILVIPQITYLDQLVGQEVGQKQWWYWFYLSNFLAAKEAALRHLFLSPTWSLAIEEQFYLLWPFVVWVCSLRWLTLISAGLIILAALLRVLLFQLEVPANSIYVLTFTRMDTIAMGALIACVLKTPTLLNKFKVYAPWLLLILAIVLVPFTSMGLMHKAKPLMIYCGYSLVALFFGIIVYYAAILKTGTLIHRALTNQVLLTLGKYSYAIYLFNRPLVPIVKKFIFDPDKFPLLLGSKIPGQILYTLILVAASYVLAYASWNLFERWFLTLKRYAPVGKSLARN